MGRCGAFAADDSKVRQAPSRLLKYRHARGAGGRFLVEKSDSPDQALVQLTQAVVLREAATMHGF